MYDQQPWPDEGGPPLCASTASTAGDAGGGALYVYGATALLHEIWSATRRSLVSVLDEFDDDGVSA